MPVGDEILGAPIDSGKGLTGEREREDPVFAYQLHLAFLAETEAQRGQAWSWLSHQAKKWIRSDGRSRSSRQEMKGIRIDWNDVVGQIRLISFLQFHHAPSVNSNVSSNFKLSTARTVEVDEPEYNGPFEYGTARHLALQQLRQKPDACVCGSPALFRCLTCMPLVLQYHSRVIAAHRDNPCHEMEKWNASGSMWMLSSLNRLGLILQTIHRGLPCPNPAAEKLRIFYRRPFAPTQSVEPFPPRSAAHCPPVAVPRTVIKGGEAVSLQVEIGYMAEKGRSLSLSRRYNYLTATFASPAPMAQNLVPIDASEVHKLDFLPESLTETLLVVDAQGGNVAILHMWADSTFHLHSVPGVEHDVPRLHCRRACWFAVPQHREEWIGEDFMKRTLRELGLRVQVGHAYRSPHAQVFSLITRSGICEADVNLCGCEASQGVDIELAELGWIRAGKDSFTFTTQDVLTFAIPSRIVFKGPVSSIVPHTCPGNAPPGGAITSTSGNMSSGVVCPTQSVCAAREERRELNNRTGAGMQPLQICRRSLLGGVSSVVAARQVSQEALHLTMERPLLMDTFKLHHMCRSADIAIAMSEVVSVSSDGCHANTVSGTVHTGSETPVYYQDDAATNAALEKLNFSYDLGDTSFVPETSEPANDGIALMRRKRYENSDFPMKTFVKNRDLFLDKWLRLEGRGDPEVYTECLGCAEKNPGFRFSLELLNHIFGTSTA
ncbi:hypothetical protein C8R44DRAFT_747053 [Mycena epipterygia]|nr:hypothetical protein C8R44DRAFT_747053 [Mycena epipterygia]